VTQLHVSPLAYYARPGPMTDLKELAPLFDGLPAEIPELVEVVQGLLIHIFWAERYGVTLSEERKQEVNIRDAIAARRTIRDFQDEPVYHMR
jgi:hypothetical protein